jgi:hypothetical protein
MDILKARYELRKMSTGHLFKLTQNQKIANCLIGGRPCGFLLPYKESNFCVSEILGGGCQVERLEQLGQLYEENEKINFLLPFRTKMKTELMLPRKKALEFRVYCRDHLTHSTVFLGKIIERRRKERGDNLKGLLSRAIKQYSDLVEDPSTIFLLEQ